MSTEIQETAVRWHGNGKTNGARAERSGVMVHRMDIETIKRVEIRDLTTAVQEMVRSAGVDAGLVTLSSMHTTTAIFVNEPQTALLDDIEQLLERLAPRGEEWKHNDPRYSDCDRQNADAHLRAIVLGSSVTLQVADGDLVMGQWQRILMAELDGPRTRQLVLQILAAR
ncbi:MAG TPA: secondary thiamine-phosphate synthase enzyme YjbQ [Candidatus Binatia bacterium]|jgi:secondary thiamine-phosphate synthase enzyme